jgi:NADPH:quinone reductase
VDVGTRAGRTAGAIPDPVFPLVPGWDVAGVVDKIGTGAARFTVGDHVVGLSMWFSTRQGTHAELVVLDEGACAYAPAGVSPTAAATLPLNGLTAWSALVTAKVDRGDRLLVTGAAGAVGGYIVQLATMRGIEVLGHGRASDRDTVLGFGAVDFVEDLAGLNGISAAIDTTGRPDAVMAIMGHDGRLVTLSARPSAERADVTVKAAWVRPDADALAQLCSLAGAGDVALRVAETCSFDHAAEAHRLIAAGGVRGRIVLVP